MSGRVIQALFRPVDLSSRVVFRIAFPAILLWEFSRFWLYGWIERYWIEPQFHFKYFGFGWVEPWPGNGMYVHVALLSLIAVLFLVGLLYRLAAPLLFLGFTYLFLLEQARYLNHFYMVCLLLFLMIFVPAHRLFSIDARLRPPIRSTVAPAWSLWLLRFQVGVVYFYGGIAKLNHDWLRGEPVGTWIERHGDTPLIGPLFVQPWSGLAFAYGGLLIDFGVVPLMLWRRTRWLGFGLVLFFNVLNSFMFNIGIFPWTMIAGSTLFFAPDWPRRLLARLRRVRPADDAPAAAPPVDPGGDVEPRLTPQRRLVLGAVAIYVAIQLLFPFRHWLYPGSVHWTEEGHRFSWHMKLRDKESECWFEVHDRVADRSWEVFPEDTLTGWQEQKMCSRPDMVLQFAHHIAEAAAAEGYAIEVRAHVFSSLHGRPYRYLVDPEVDLVKVPRTLGHADWITPMDHSVPMDEF